jgi:hypothetical protein
MATKSTRRHKNGGGAEDTESGTEEMDSEFLPTEHTEYTEENGRIPSAII